MNKLLLKIYILIMAFLTFNSLAFAADTGTPTKYAVSIHSFKLYNGTDDVPVFSGTSGILDIASVSGTSAFVGNFMSGLAVPDGTYTKAKVQPSATFTIKGTVASGRRTDGTLTGGNCTAVTTAGDPVDCTLTVDSSYVPEQEYTFSTPITVKDGVANHKVRVYFDVSNSIVYEGGIIHPVQPSCTVSVE